MISDSDFQRISERASRRQWDKHAFDCKRCPGSGCPAWWSTTWNRTTADGYEVVPVEGCSFVLSQLYSQGSLAAGIILRSGLGQVRDEIQNTVKKGALGLAKLVASVQAETEQLYALVSPRQQKSIGSGSTSELPELPELPPIDL
jgi:hypothetical protein